MRYNSNNMARPKLPQTKRTYLQARITASEATEIVLNRLQDLYGNNLTMASFGDVGYLVINPGTDNAEIISFTGFTVNDDDTVSLDTSIVRGLKGVSDYGTGGTAKAHSAGTPVIVSNVPHIFEAILDYIDSVAIAGVSDADETTAGISEMATTAEIDADTEEGATTRKLFVNPANLATSIYRTRLPSSTEKEFLGVASGAIMPFVGDTAPTGWLDCDGSDIALDTYPTLAALLVGRFGIDAGTVITSVDTATDKINLVSHGLSDGERILFYTDDTLPTGLSENTIYFVVNSATNDFQVSTSAGGDPVDITGAGSGNTYFSATCKVPDLRGSTIIGKGQKSIALDFAADDVTVTGLPGQVSDSSASGGTVTFASAHGLSTGDAIVFDTSFYGVVAGTVYYVEVASSTIVKLFTTRANALLAASNHNTDPSPVNITTNNASGYNAFKVGVFNTTQKIPEYLQTGVEVVISTDDTLPVGLTAGTYYFVRVDDFSFKLDKTRIDAMTGPEGIAVADTGTGTHTATMTMTSRTLGEDGGEEDHQLMISEMPSHDHNYGSYSGHAPGGSSGPTGGPSDWTGYTGGDGEHNNMQPYVVANWIIKT